MTASIPQETSIRPGEFKSCLRHIEKYWKQITCNYPEDKFRHFGLPHPFVSPNDGIYLNDQFYWDSYFIILGLVKCGRAELARGMVDNFLFMQKRFNIIPMRNRFYNLGSSQVPFLTSMAREVFQVTGDRRWFSTVMQAAEHELKDYWMNRSLTEIHVVHQGLSRYCDHYITHLAAEHESGWDMTSRFHDHCLDYLPIDLNCALYRYETDLAAYYKLMRNRARSERYIVQSEKRRRKINSLMWDFDKGFYFDYNYRQKKRSGFYSIAGFYPLWAKLATHTQAKKMADNLRRFEYEHGLANTQSTGLADEYRQHDYPNGWPHQHWVVVRGLMNYGFRDDAFRIALKFLRLVKKHHLKTGHFWEKYNMVDGEVGTSERYPTQTGFGWTNAVFLRFVAKFSPPP